MIGYTRDDGGREAAGYKGSAGDCVIRAFCILTGADYRTAYKEFANANHWLADGPKSGRRGIAKTAYESVFKAHGLKKVKLPKGPRPTYSEAYERYGDCIVSTRGHLCAIVDGDLRDTFDGRGYLWDSEWGIKVGNGLNLRSIIGKRNGEIITPENAERLGFQARERKAMSVWTP